MKPGNGLLCLTIKHGQSFTIGTDIIVTIEQTSGNAVKAVISAPKEISIKRIQERISDLYKSNITEETE